MPEYTFESHDPHKERCIGCANEIEFERCIEVTSDLNPESFAMHEKCFFDLYWSLRFIVDNYAIPSEPIGGVN